MIKTCRTCKIEKTYADYTINKHIKDGYNNECKDCAREKARLRYAANSKENAAKAKTRRQHNPDSAKQALKKYRQKEHEVIASWRRYQRQNQDQKEILNFEDFKIRFNSDASFKEQMLASSRKARKATCIERKKAKRELWEQKNQEKINMYRRDWALNKRKTDLDWHKREKEIKTVYRHKNWHKDVISNSSWIRGASDKVIDAPILRRLHGWQKDHCYFCNIPLEKFTIEHILPRKRGGPSTDQNLVLTCVLCNSGRKDRIYHLDWRPRKVFPVENHTYLQSRNIKKDLKDADIIANLLPDGSWEITAPNAKTKILVIISTFFGSDRNPASRNGRMAKWAQEHFEAPIILFDHEWYNRRASCINMLKSKLGIALRAPGARKLDLIDVNATDAKEFLDTHHVMGNVNAPIRIGLTDGETLFGLGEFHDKGEVWECDRLAFHGHVPGGMSRIMKSLWATKGAKPIRTFVDSRYADGGGHETIGFKHVGYSPESYQWVLPNRVQHQRFLSNMNKMLRNLLYIREDASREDNIKANGIFKIWTPKRHIVVWEP